MLKIVADENIPLVQHYFATANVLLKPGRSITRDDLLDADILLVRSVTHVNEKLLQQTAVKFVGSVTTGQDHLDTQWLDQQHISWSVALGCNARAVVEYVVCVLAALQKNQILADKKLRVGVMGVGRIGQQVVDVMQALGHEVIQCDPFRALAEKNFSATPIEEFADLDFISLHTPLTKHGPFPTYHLIEKNFLQRQKKNCVLLNAGRGAVINFNDLKLYGEHLIWCLDVFEQEPYVDFDVLNAAVVATPHIAGYSVQSKYRGIEMIYQAARQNQLVPEQLSTNADFPTRSILFANQIASWQDVVLTIFDPLALTQKMKASLVDDPEKFDQLRKQFNDRFEFGFVCLKQVAMHVDTQSILKRLGVGALADCQE